MNDKERVGLKTIRRFQESIRNKRKEMGDRFQEKEDRLNEVAKILSGKYTLDKLIKASDPKKAGNEGREVHGFMEEQFPDYFWLIDNDVLDRACHQALKEFKPIHYCYLENFDLENMYLTLVTWDKKVHFDLFPEFEFNRCVLLSLEPINEAINFVNDYEPYELEGYETSVRLGPVNLLNGGLPLYDLPIFVVKDAVGKDKFFFQAKTSSEELTKIRDELLKKLIFEMRQKEKANEEKIEELEIESSVSRKLYADLKHKMLSRSPFSDEHEFEAFEKQYVKKQQKGIVKIEWRKILIGLGIIVLIVFLIIGCVFLFSPPTTT